MLFARLVLPRTTAESIISASAPKGKVKKDSLATAGIMMVTNQEVRSLY